MLSLGCALKPQTRLRAKQPVRPMAAIQRRYAIMDRYTFPATEKELQKEVEAQQKQEQDIQRKERKRMLAEIKHHKKWSQMQLRPPGEEVLSIQEDEVDSPPNAKYIQVSLIGPANAGKSTLVSRICGSRISAISPKAHTTRRNLTGLVTIGETQIAVIDTPGVVSRKEQSKYNTELVDSSWRALDEVDIALVTVDAVKTIGPEVRDLFVGLKKYQSNFEQNAEKTAARLKARIEDGMVDDEYTRKGFKAVLLLNKADLYKPENFRNVEDGQDPYPIITRWRYEFPELDKLFDKVFVMSALTKLNVDEVKDYIVSNANVHRWMHSPEKKVVASQLGVVEDIIREKCFRRYNQETPYMIQQHTSSWNQRKDGVVIVHHELIVPRKSMMNIVIGSGGECVLAIKHEAERDIASILGIKVILKIAVRHRENYVAEAMTEESQSM